MLSCNQSVILLETRHFLTADPEVLEWHRKLGHLVFVPLAELVASGVFCENSPEPSAFVQAKGKQCDTCI